MGSIRIDNYTIENFNKENQYVFFGESALVDKIQYIFKESIKVKFILDNDKNKWENFYNGLAIRNSDSIDELDKNTRIIITASTTKSQLQILEQLKKKNYNMGETVILASDFIRLWKWHYEEKIAINYVEQMITSRCTLNCKNCGLYIPFFEEKMDRCFENIILDFESLFETVDYVAEFRILGGEPLLYTKLESLLTFIANRYRENIGILAIVTNGTIIPSREILQVCKNNKITFHISDYTKTLDYLLDKQKTLVKLLEREGIMYNISSTSTWADVGNPNIKQSCTIDEVINRFRFCKMPCRSLLNQKLYFCGTMASSVLAKLYIEKEEDVIDLKQVCKLEKMDKLKKIEAFELGINKKGFIDYCYYCNGFGDNNLLVPVAIQS